MSVISNKDQKRFKYWYDKMVDGLTKKNKRVNLYTTSAYLITVVRQLRLKYGQVKEVFDLYIRAYEIDFRFKQAQNTWFKIQFYNILARNIKPLQSVSYDELLTIETILINEKRRVTINSVSETVKTMFGYFVSPQTLLTETGLSKSAFKDVSKELKCLQYNNIFIF